jgi:pyruvate kinase
MDIARINLAHGKKAEHLSLTRLLRSVAHSLAHPLGILVDLPGPKIRLGPLKDKVIFLHKSALFNLTVQPCIGDDTTASINYPQILRKIRKGMNIFLNDGLIKLKVLENRGRKVVCLVENSGEIRAGKGVNIPGISLEYEHTLEDKRRLLFALGLRPDFLALSFVRQAEDVKWVRAFSGKYAKDIFLIAKIEKREALKNIDEIIDLSDGVMVARGDLGVEISLEELPWAQKDVVEKANQKARPVIVATQILESMVNSPSPTRAEVTDIANAVLDGADCLMLSEETAIGRYPKEAVAVLRKVARITEKRFSNLRYLDQKIARDSSTLEAISYAAAWTVHNLSCKIMAIPALSGQTARWVSKFRPQAMILTLAKRENILRRLNIFWGVYPVRFPFRISLEKLPQKIEIILRKLNLARRGEKLVIVASHSLGKSALTNFIQVHRIV